MEGKTNQRVMLTKRLLKDSLIQKLKQESIYKISIRELCEQAGINRSTFYKYYGNQFDLLREMEEDMLHHVQQTLMESGREKTESISGVCAYLEQNIELSRLLINNNIDPKFPERLFSMPYIRQEIMNTLNSHYGEAEFEYASCFLTYGCYHLVRRWINKDEHEPPEKIAALLMGMIERFI